MEETKDDEIQEQTHAHETSPTHAQETSPSLFKMKRTRTKFWEHIMLIAPSNEKKHGNPKTLLERGA